MSNLLNFHKIAPVPSTNGAVVPRPDETIAGGTPLDQMTLIEFKDGPNGFEATYQNDGPPVYAWRMVILDRPYSFIPGRSDGGYNYKRYFTDNMYDHEFADPYKGYENLPTGAQVKVTGFSPNPQGDSNPASVIFYGDRTVA